ncbi:MAG: phosphoglucomutase [Blastochloris sp.]|nr:phosphoglucomutase [Blastochloris sp.]
MTIRPRFVTSRWDGVFTTDFTLAHVRQRCFHIGQALLARGWSCLVAYDTRFMSSLYAIDVYRMLQQQGVAVNLASTPIALPAVQWSLSGRQDRAAIVVSAGNRPYWYNGLVVVRPTGSDPLMTGETGFISPATLDGGPFPALGAEADIPAEQRIDVRSAYLDMLRSLVDVNLMRSLTLTIFADPMNGTMAGCLPAVIGEGSYTKAVEINREPDPLFSLMTPLPATAGLARLRKLVRESDSNIGLAFSADGSALSVVDKTGELIEPLEIALILGAYLVRQQRQRGLVVARRPPKGAPSQQQSPGSIHGKMRSASRWRLYRMRRPASQNWRRRPTIPCWWAAPQRANWCSVVILPTPMRWLLAC